jgi:hypothetical protein
MEDISYERVKYREEDLFLNIHNHLRNSNS